MTPSPLLVTFPGRAGDLLWALPSIRALSRRLGHPIDLMIAGEFAGMIDLLRQQPYLGYVGAASDWSMSHGWQPPQGVVADCASEYDRILHLGYRRWPERPLAQETLHTLNCANQFPRVVGSGTDPIYEVELDLQTPWITVEWADRSDSSIVAGFSETHCETKMGVLFALGNQGDRMIDVLVMPKGRYEEEWGGPCTVDYNLQFHESTWTNAAWLLANARVALCCNSGLHVLAVALGTPVVMLEPMEARWNPIFFPVGQDGPQVTLVKGHDGLPTFDVRAVKAALTAALERTAP